MIPETLEALKGSIEKWRKIVEENGEDRGTENCPLCQLFLLRHDNIHCRGCPIDTVTGGGCTNPEFFAWIRAPGDDCFASTTEAMAAARAELDFLRSLLPKEEGE